MSKRKTPLYGGEEELPRGREAPGAPVAAAAPAVTTAAPSGSASAASGSNKKTPPKKAPRPASAPAHDPGKLFFFASPEPSPRPQTKSSVSAGSLFGRLLAGNRDSAAPEPPSTNVPPFDWGRDDPNASQNTRVANFGQKPSRVASSTSSGRSSAANSASATSPASPGQPNFAPGNAKPQAASTPAQNKPLPQAGQPSAAQVAEKQAKSPPTRTLATVLKRLGNLTRKDNPTHQLDLREHWMPDSNAKVCYECESQFNTFRRRHHCRVCGQIFCWRCCREEVSGMAFGYRGELRCCAYCARVIQNVSHNQGNLEQGVHPDLLGIGGSRQASTPKTSVFGALSDRKTAPPSTVSMFSSPAEISPLVCLGLLRRAIADGSLEVKSRRDRLVTYPNCLVASEFVDWLVSTEYVKKRSQAVSLGQALLDAKYLVHVRHNEAIFKDEYQLYHITENAFKMDNDDGESSSDEDISALFDDADVPSWFRQITAPEPIAIASDESEDEDEEPTPLLSSKGVPQNASRWSQGVAARMPTGPILTDVSEMDGDKQILDRQSFDETVEAQMEAANEQHMLKHLAQRLEYEGLDQSWGEVIHRLVKQVDANVRPNVRGGDQADIRSYVKVKCLPGSEPCESWFSSGAIFTKDVAHKKMRRVFRRPKILLLRFALEFQRAENNRPKYSSLEVLMMQEEEFLKKSVQKIVLWQPDIVMVERTVSRRAQDMILKEGLTLMLNVKPTVMNYVARLTQADILESIEHLSFQPRLGRCERFELRTYELPDGTKKTLTLIDGCDPHRGCTIVVRGGEMEELKKVKRTLKFIAYVKYSLQLELQFIRNECAILQDCVNDSILEDSLPEPMSRTNSDPTGVIVTADPRSRRRKCQVSTAPDLDVNTWIDEPHAQAFKQVLDSVTLSTSPLVVMPAPYVYSVASYQSPARKLVPTVCFWSPKLLEIPDAQAGRTDMPDDAKDCFDPEEHQHLQVLFSCWTEGTKPCILPRLLTLEFYGQNDVTLGYFIEEYCFRASNNCPAGQCDKSIESHLRSFVHGRGRINVGMERLREPIDPDGKNISIWSWCKVCQQVTPPVLMNEQVWNISFAKCLELICLAPGYIDRGLNCPHSVHHNHVSYFGQGTLTVYFDYEPIELMEVVIPSTLLRPSRPSSYLVNCQRLVENMDTSCTRLWEDVGMRLFSFDVEAVEPSKADIAQHAVSELKENLCEQQQVATTIREQCLQELEVAHAAGAADTTAASADASQLVDFARADRVEKLLYELKLHIRDWVGSWNKAFQELLPSFAPKKPSKWHSQPASSSGTAAPSDRSSPRLGLPASSRPSSRSGSRTSSPASMLDSQEASGSDVFEPTSPQPPQLTNVPGAAAKRLPPRNPEARRRSASGAPVSSSDVSRESSGTDELKQPSWVDVGDNPVPSSAVIEANRERRKEQQGVMKKIATLLPSQSTQPRDIKMPFPVEHHIFPPGRRPGIVVYEDEPSSIIAYALASREHADFLEGRRLSQARRRSLPKRPPMPPPTSADGGPAQSKGGSEEAQLFEFEFRDKVTNFYCQVPFAREFHDLRQEFLSSQEGDDPEDDFIRSLSRCVKWEAHGGKSGAAFCKMSDDRYILKQMSRSEAHSILEFAPHYVNHMRKVCKHNKPSVMAKIVGVYIIGFTNLQTNREMKQSVLVMENLFYSRRINRIFDLKGSMRSRYVKTTGRDDDVLLDENLLEFICESPLFVRQHSKVVLEEAIRNDTTFLMKHAVMDYSLLVGIDEDNKELVVGIIDYIRTFTWDKKLEMWIKSSGILGGRGNLPTVVSPEAYKARFKEAMSLYFLTVPDRWSSVAMLTKQATQAAKQHKNIA